MKQGDLIAVNGKIYEYVGWVEKFKKHEVAIVEVDDEGNFTATYIHDYVAPEEIRNNEVRFTRRQWVIIVEHFLRQDYDLTEEEIEDTAYDIVGRCFTYGIPKFHELPNYITEYMDR